MSDQVFYTKPSKMIRGAIFCFFLGACGAYGIYDLYLGFAFGKHTDARAWAAALCILGLPLGPLFLFEAVRKHPKLTISDRGLRLERTLRPTWAEWDGLGSFEIMTIREKIRLAKAPVFGPNTDARTQKTRVFVIPDSFDLPFDELVATINSHISPTETHASKTVPLAS